MVIIFYAQATADPLNTTIAAVSTFHFYTPMELLVCYEVLPHRMISTLNPQSLFTTIHVAIHISLMTYTSCKNHHHPHFRLVPGMGKRGLAQVKCEPRLVHR